ncbi:MAG: DNA ligase [Methylomicrobium sp.]|nr:DNA ligase [Methylomicrobium sp.]
MSGIEVRTFRRDQLIKVAEMVNRNSNIISEVKTHTLVDLINDFNLSYRAGDSLIPDVIYDSVFIEELRRRDPNHEFLKRVEPEPELIDGKTVQLPQRMLSTDKAYSIDAIEKWVGRIAKAAAEIGFARDNLLFKITPKLDGFAAYDDGERLYTRGDGYKGTDITHAFENGLDILGRCVSDTGEELRGKGPGEIVVSKTYFEKHLSGKYENSRNVIASVIKESELDVEIKTAIVNKAILFAPFSMLNCCIVATDVLLEDFGRIRGEMLESIFDVDGIVIECVNEPVKQHMGHTNHHHRWQIAFKENTEYHDIEVEGLVWQTSKTGRITPVVQLKPTKVSGVTISRATGHHYGNVQSKGIDAGAIVKVCRSGLVIPYIKSVVKPVEAVKIPAWCPSCNAPTCVDGDNLLCSNEMDCPAQIESTIEYFFKTIGNCDGFGPRVIEQLCAGNTVTIGDFYDGDTEDLIREVIGGKMAENLIGELQASRQRPIEDWRFLAAFSIPNVGKGGCERLLKRHRLEDVFDLTVDQIVEIDGFAEKTATVLVDSLRRIKGSFDALYSLGFNLIQTPLNGEKTAILSPISNKTIVFTGSMQSGSRSELQKRAKALGATVASSVTGKTNYLVCGDKVGAAKTEAALKKGVKVLTEEAYLKLLGDL